MVGFKLNPTWI